MNRLIMNYLVTGNVLSQALPGGRARGRSCTADDPW